jgi:dTDP-glucose pyrophosphorylase
MITVIIPIAGNSSRFFNAGYTTVKYKLPIQSRSVLWHILSYINRDYKLLVVSNIKFNDKKWLTDLLEGMGFKHFEIIEVSDTDGQLTTVRIGIINSKIVKDSDNLIIYNGDTIRHIPFNFNFNNSDGFIEVFKQKGSHWSFVDNLGDVGLVTEKKRISQYCSTGLYGFSSVKIFIKFSLNAQKSLGEKYIAPIYNELIKNNLSVKSYLTESSNFTLCGTPDDYEKNIT